MTIRGLEVRGFIDLLVRDRNDGRLIVVDHKSKSRFKSDQELELYGFQPYLYAEWVLQTYGEYPKELVFNLFRAGDQSHHPLHRGGKGESPRLAGGHRPPGSTRTRISPIRWRSAAGRGGSPSRRRLRQTSSASSCGGVRHRCARSGLCIDGGTM